MNKKRLFFVVISVFLCALQSVYANDPKDITNWTDGGTDYGDKFAYDTSWYKASDSEYTISTPEQLGAFAAASETATFEGKTVKLAADLDMSRYGWVSIGKAGFKGSFDGMGHTITRMTYMDASQVKAWSLFHTIDGGTVKNVLVTESVFANDQLDSKKKAFCPSVGGIASILKGNGSINNCGFSGSLQVPFNDGTEILGKQNGLVGGLVGIIESGTVTNSFAINQQPFIPNDTIYGNLAGRSKGTISNCYFMLNDTLPGAVNKDQAQGTLNKADGKEAGSFASGEVAYLLNTDNKGAWGQNNGIPALAGGKALAVCKITYPVDQENGKVTGKEYAGIGETVTLTSLAEEGYVVKDLKVIGAALVNYSTFVMPDKDVTVSYRVEAISATEILALPAENIKSKSFVAKWNKVEGATNYKITVKKGDVALSTYNALSVGDVTSVLVEGLNQTTDYSYTVQAVKGEAASEASNNISVTTAGLEVTVASKEGHIIDLTWDTVEGADKYTVAIATGAGIFAVGEAKDCAYRCTGLAAGVTYSIVVSAKDASDLSLSISNPVTVTTDLDYGTQLKNSSFEAWHNEKQESEPVAWHSFMSGGGGLSSMTKNVHMDKSNEVRPGSTGLASVCIWTKTIMSVPANGNLTCGRVNSGSMTATDQANHNRSFIDEPEFCQPLNGARPDSLTVWVNFSHKEKNMFARVAATIHDKYNFADPSTDADLLHAVAKAELDYKAVDQKGGWQRLTIPFDYELKHLDAFYDRMNQDQHLKDSLGVETIVKPTSADYMLVTFSTNKTPGVGKANDQVLIDDLVLIYKPELKITKTSFTGKQATVEYTLVGTMSPSNLNVAANVVSLELSDARGSFAEPKVLAQITTDKSGKLVADVEEDLTKGDYRIRVVTTNYPMISDEIYTATGVAAIKAVVATDITGDSFVANWTAPLSQEPTNYKLTVKEGDRVVGEYNDKETGRVTSYSVEGLQANVTYTYTVKAVYDEVVTGVSNAIEITTKPIVQALDATDVTEKSFTANWEAVAVQPDNYLLTIKEGKFVLPGYEDLVIGGTVTTYKATSMKPNTIYTYSVRAVYGDEILKASNEITFTTPVASITAKAASSVTDNSFIANWNAPANALPTAYRMTVKQGTVVLEGYDNKEISAGVTSYKMEGLKPNTAYSYIVKAIYGDKESEYTKVIEVTTKVPAVKALDATNVGETEFTANWEAPTSMEAINYQITVIEGNKALPGYENKETGVVTSFKVEGLKANTKYTYSVKAVYGDNLISYTPSSLITVTTLKPVGIDNATTNGNVFVYPNPTVDVLNIKGVAEEAAYTIYDMSGCTIDKGNLSNNMVDVRNLRSGMYFIETASGKAKFIKK